MTRLYDLTLPISEELPVWPGDPPITIARVSQADGAESGTASVSQICLSSHAGTHVDPPAHFFPGGATVDQLPLERLIGPAWVAEILGAGIVSASALEQAGIPNGIERLLLHTVNADRQGDRRALDIDFVGLSADAADWVVARGIRLVGIDGPSIEPYDSPGEPVHHRLLSTGVIIVENLALAGIPAGYYQLCCLPLRLAGGDGAPARAVLISDT
jgi:arylformamidase